MVELPVLGALEGSVMSAAVTVALPAVLRVTLKVAMPLTRGASGAAWRKRRAPVHPRMRPTSADRELELARGGFLTKPLSVES